MSISIKRWLFRIGATLALSLSFARAASAASAFATYQPLTVDPPVTRPSTHACVVRLYRDTPFANSPPLHSDYAPPAHCRGPWSRVVLTFDTRVAGIQYDRLGSMWLGRDEIFRFSTAEPTRHGIAYRVEKDVSAYIPILRAPGIITTELANVVNRTYTGIIFASATLSFYEATRRVPAAPVADRIFAVARSTGPHPVDTTGRLTVTLARLPRNIVRATLDLYASNHGCDEGWYTNQPDAYAARHRDPLICGGGAYREIDIAIDSRPANVVYPFPYIWTGGVNPLLWRPISDLNALDVPSYAVDLDPWAGVLSDGRPHRITISVMNDRGVWPLDGNLMIWTDRGGARTRGAIVRDTLRADAPVTAQQQLAPHGGTFAYKAWRQWQVRGYVDTSGGRVWHGIDERMRYTDINTLDLASGRQNGTQTTVFTTVTSSRDASGFHRRRVSTSYPLVANYTMPPASRVGPYALVIDAAVRQGRHVRADDGSCDAVVAGTALLKRSAHHVDEVSIGRTIETNACRGTYGTFTIVGRAVNGRGTIQTRSRP